MRLRVDERQQPGHPVLGGHGQVRRTRRPPPTARLAKIHHGAPAKNSTAMNTIVSATVVPRSGCMHDQPGHQREHRQHRDQQRPWASRAWTGGRPARAPSTAAAPAWRSRWAGTANPPIRIQLRAPLTSAPMPGTSTATSSASETITAVVDSRAQQPAPAGTARRRSRPGRAPRRSPGSRRPRTTSRRCGTTTTADDDSTISRPKPSISAKIASTRCSEVIGRSSQSHGAPSGRMPADDPARWRAARPPCRRSPGRRLRAVGRLSSRPGSVPRGRADRRRPRA